MVASILAVFNIGVPTGEDPVDNALGGEQGVTSGLISYVIVQNLCESGHIDTHTSFPMPFSCSIKLRSSELMALLYNSQL